MTVRFVVALIGILFGFAPASRAQTQNEEVARLAGLLQSPDWATRQEAVTALGKLGSAAKVEAPALMRALRDEESRVRYFAARAIGELGKPEIEAIDALASVLHDFDGGVRTNAGVALAKIGKRAIPALMAVLNSLDFAAREEASRTLAEIGAPAIRPLMQALGDKRNHVRQSAGDSLGLMGTPALPSLIKTLKSDERTAARVAAASALAKSSLRIGAKSRARALCRAISAKIVPALLAALQDKEWEVRESASIALGRIGGAAAAIPALITLCDDAQQYVRLSAQAALARIGRENCAALLERLHDENGGFCAEILEALAEIGAPDRAVPELVTALRDADRRVRIGAAGALWTTGANYAERNGDGKDSGSWKLGAAAEKTVSALAGALADKEGEVRKRAAAALAEIGAEAAGATASLIATLSDAEVEVRWRAATALGCIGSGAKWAIPALITLYQEDADEYLKERVAQALSRIDPQFDKNRLRNQKQSVPRTRRYSSQVSSICVGR